MPLPTRRFASRRARLAPPSAIRAERRLRDVETTARLGSFQLDLASGAVMVSPSLRRLVGPGFVREADLARILDHVHPNDSAKVAHWIARNAARRPAPHGCFFRLIREDGTIGIYHGRSALYPARHGAPARICGTIEDVTEQVQSERAVNEAAHLYRDIFENCAWGVFQTTADGRYLMANPALAKIYGYESPDGLLSRLTDIGGQLYLDPGRRAEFVRIMREDGEVKGFESEARRRDGSAIWISETCREVRTSTGNLLYYEGTVEDITERKAGEAALKRARAQAEAAKEALEAANRDLERRVAERTAELRAMQEQMIQRERLSTLGQLIATVAHELRNPLSAIRNSLHAVRVMAGPPNAALDRPLARIDRSIARCETFIEDLTEFAHAHRIDPHATRLDEWVAEFCAAAKAGAGTGGIALEFRPGAGETVLRIDKTRMKRALDNIVENAVQALAETARETGGAGRIAIATSGGAAARIVVADNGPGIAPEIMPKVFDPLFSTKSFGSGLGLPTAKQIVEQHGGIIAITSEAGRGTRVEIALPIAEDGKAAAEMAA